MRGEMDEEQASAWTVHARFGRAQSTTCVARGGIISAILEGDRSCTSNIVPRATLDNLFPQRAERIQPSRQGEGVDEHDR
jgi:hypothetical protein